MPPWYHSSLAYTTTRRVAVGGGKVSEEKPPVNMQFLHTRNRTPALLIGNQIPIAQALRYEICRCTFPPQIMLSQGYRENREHFQCPRCGNTWPPPGSGEIEVVKDFEAFGD